MPACIILPACLVALFNNCLQEIKTLPAELRADAEKRAKQRLLGNIRLIAELFNKAQVNDRIMLLILADLLGGVDNDPPEDSVEVRVIHI